MNFIAGLLKATRCGMHRSGTLHGSGLGVKCDIPVPLLCAPYLGSILSSQSHALGVLQSEK